MDYQPFYTTNQGLLFRWTKHSILPIRFRRLFSPLLFRFWIQKENQISSHKNKLSIWTNEFPVFLCSLRYWLIGVLCIQKQYDSPGVNFCYFYAYVICKCYFHQKFVGISSITIFAFSEFYMEITQKKSFGFFFPAVLEASNIFHIYRVKVFNVCNIIINGEINF